MWRATLLGTGGKMNEPSMLKIFEGGIQNSGRLVWVISLHIKYEILWRETERNINMRCSWGNVVSLSVPSVVDYPSNYYKFRRKENFLWNVECVSIAQWWAQPQELEFVVLLCLSPHIFPLAPRTSECTFTCVVSLLTNNYQLYAVSCFPQVSSCH